MTKSMTVYVDNPHEPTLNITSEIPEAASGTITIKGTASDSDGEITKIEIQIDDGEWKEATGTTDWSYSLDTTKLSDGEHTIKIRVYDNEGEYYIESLTISVNNSTSTFWLLLIVLIVILVISLIVGVGLKKKKTKPGSGPTHTQSIDQTETQNFKCPQCNNVFETWQSNTTIQCPYCGLSGTAT